MQEVYVTIWRRADRFDASRASVVTWISTIARNRAIDRLRARGPLAYADQVEDLQIPDSGVGAEALLVAAGEETLREIIRSYRTSASVLCLSEMERKKVRVDCG